MKKLTYLAVCALMASCSAVDSDELVSSPQCSSEPTGSHVISRSEAVNIAASFRNGSGTLSRSGDADESDIENVVVLRWEDLYPGVPNPVIGGDDPTSRASDSGQIAVDILFYIVNEKNNAGYTMVAAYDYTDPIYAVIDRGNYHPGDWAHNGLDDLSVQILDRTVEALLSDLNLTLYPYIPTGTVEMYHQVEPPMLKTEWNRTMSYVIPAASPGEDDRDTVCTFGSLAVAVGQLLAYGSIVPDGYPYDINWGKILDECQKKPNHGCPESDESKMQVFQLVGYLDSSLSQESWPNSPIASNVSAHNWFLNQNLNNDDFKHALCDTLTNHIGGGDMICMYAPVFKDNGIKNEFWVIDGYYTCTYYDGRLKRNTSYLLHCNWGLGGKFNGIFLERLFDGLRGGDPNEYKNIPFSFEPDDCIYSTITFQ